MAIPARLPARLRLVPPVATPAEPAPRPPASRLPYRYFALAHACLITAFATIAVFTPSFAGFFYHARMLAVVHLVTLGWISSAILGSLYMIAPMALRTHLHETRLDRWTFWIWTIGVSGMVAHFWIEEASGMVYAALFVLFGLVVVGARTFAALRVAPIGRGVKLHFRLAFANILLAGGLGFLLGLNRIFPFFGAAPLTQLYAHAHLAALGWATMMVCGAGHRLLPMLLPARPAPDSAALVGAILLELGSLGLFAGFLGAGVLLPVAALATLGGLVWFLAQVGRMLRARLRAGPAIPRPDFARLHALQALLYLALATALGLVLAFLPASEASLRLAPVYATAGLLGFLGQMILGVSARQLPVLMWIHATVGIRAPAVSPYRLLHRGLAATELAMWSLGVPVLAAGLWLERPAPIRTGALLLLTAATASAMNFVYASRSRALESLREIPSPAAD